MPTVLAFLITLCVAFLLGSIPSGIIVGKLLYGVDIRDHGSGNIGTTNAMRALGKTGGAVVFLLDFGKGLLAGLVALALVWFAVPGGGLESDSLLRYSTFVAAAFFGCIAGHIFSPWLGFKGGKGIAVAVGCLFVTFGPVGALLELASFILVVLITRYVSAGSLTAAVLCPVFSAYYFLLTDTPDWLAWILCTAGAALVIWAHRGNIQRLLAGEERRIGDPKDEEPAH